jgi:hypothetical protein
VTPAEIIAVKLFGWRHDGYWPSVGKRYKHPNRPDCRVYEDGEGVGSDTWPDFSDWNSIRRMEDALAERGLMEGSPSEPSYTRMLRRIVGPDQSDYCVGLRATAEQRVAAALKVIEEAGL